ncbi:hypothetical protein ACQ4LE_006917 [Meloidogyne hapla]
MNDTIRRSDPCGDYELLQRVGTGSYGEVYKARDLKTGLFTAVKIVKLEHGDNFASIQQEVLMLRDCVHPNIIAYNGSYLRRDRLWIVMEYCGGGSLQDIYQMTGPLTELQIAFVCRETLKGLKYLHQRGKVHRDVKGPNILLTHTGDIKLADFGIAAQITATLGKRLSFIGTPYWMAPEVADVESRGGYGSEVDVWAVGITAIELAELKPPYFELPPIQVLHLMTKSNYKVPKLKDKKKWSPTFAQFIKACLTKNPKKRPSPDKLLTTNPFVSGALSSRLTRELLDRVNHPDRIDRHEQQQNDYIEGNVIDEKEVRRNKREGRENGGNKLRESSESEQEEKSRTATYRVENFALHHQQQFKSPFINNRQNGRKNSKNSKIIQQNDDRPSSSSSSSSSISSLASNQHGHVNLGLDENDVEGDDEVFDDWNSPNRQQQISYQSEKTLLASQGDNSGRVIDLTLQESSSDCNIFEPSPHISSPLPNSPQKRPKQLNIPKNHQNKQQKPQLQPQRSHSSLSSCQQPKSSLIARTPTTKASRILARIDESLKLKWNRLRSKSASLLNVQQPSNYYYAINKNGAFASPNNNNSPATMRYGNTLNQHHSHHPFQSRPMTCCFGMVPTPQVTMGACFVTVLHKSPINVNCCAQWYHPANRKQFMVLGAEQGVYALDLSDMSGEDEAPLVQLHERRCTWLHIVNDTITALQGKTPYLYRHDLLQLFQQELITQKLANKLQRLPEKFKPKALIGSIRMPETKDCYQCNVERSINDGELYLCCAVPNAVLLFRWYDPLTRFVWLKRVELDKLSLPYLGPQHPHRPFNLVFTSGAANSDYPMVCIGISRALTSPVGTAEQLLNDLRNKTHCQRDRLELQFVNFNGPDSNGVSNGGQLFDLFSSDIFGGGSSDEDCCFTPQSAPGRSPGTFSKNGVMGADSGGRTIWRWREKLENVVALKQLDRDTLFLAYNNQILITDLSGNQKKTDLMQTHFIFDSRLEYAIPLSDSVLGFHKHGIQGKSFFRGTITQELNDPSRDYHLVGKDSLIVLKMIKRRRTHNQSSTSSQNNNNSNLPNLTHVEDVNVEDEAEDIEDEEEEDICVLTGHISTMTPP